MRAYLAATTRDDDVWMVLGHERRGKWLRLACLHSLATSRLYYALNLLSAILLCLLPFFEAPPRSKAATRAMFLNRTVSGGTAPVEYSVPQGYQTVNVLTGLALFVLVADVLFDIYCRGLVRRQVCLSRSQPKRLAAAAFHGLPVPVAGRVKARKRKSLRTLLSLRFLVLLIIILDTTLIGKGGFVLHLSSGLRPIILLLQHRPTRTAGTSFLRSVAAAKEVNLLICTFKHTLCLPILTGRFFSCFSCFSFSPLCGGWSFLRVRRSKQTPNLGDSSTLWSVQIYRLAEQCKSRLCVANDSHH